MIANNCRVCGDPRSVQYVQGLYHSTHEHHKSVPREQFRDFIVPSRVTLLPDHISTLVCYLICF